MPNKIENILLFFLIAMSLTNFVYFNALKIKDHSDIEI